MICNMLPALPMPHYRNPSSLTKINDKSVIPDTFLTQPSCTSTIQTTTRIYAIIQKTIWRISPSSVKLLKFFERTQLTTAKDRSIVSCISRYHSKKSNIVSPSYKKNILLPFDESAYRESFNLCHSCFIL